MSEPKRYEVYWTELISTDEDAERQIEAGDPWKSVILASDYDNLEAKLSALRKRAEKAEIEAQRLETVCGNLVRASASNARSLDLRWNELIRMRRKVAYYIGEARRWMRQYDIQTEALDRCESLRDEWIGDDIETEASE